MTKYLATVILDRLEVDLNLDNYNSDTISVDEFFEALDNDRDLRYNIHNQIVTQIKEYLATKNNNEIDYTFLDDDLIKIS